MWWWCLDFFFFFKQKTAYEMRISDWSSDVCSSDLLRCRFERLQRLDQHARAQHVERHTGVRIDRRRRLHAVIDARDQRRQRRRIDDQHARQMRGRIDIKRMRDVDMTDEVRDQRGRSEEHTSELQSLMRISYAVFCLNKKQQ